jgi:hypothetical protein
VIAAGKRAMPGNRHTVLAAAPAIGRPGQPKKARTNAIEEAALAIQRGPKRINGSKKSIVETKKAIAERSKAIAEDLLAIAF